MSLDEAEEVMVTQTSETLEISDDLEVNADYENGVLEGFYLSLYGTTHEVLIALSPEMAEKLVEFLDVRLAGIESEEEDG